MSFQVEDVWTLPEKDRWRLYRRWVCDARRSCYEAITDFQEMFDDKVEELKEVRKEEEYEILKNADVIGLTTTGNLIFFVYEQASVIVANLTLWVLFCVCVFGLFQVHIQISKNQAKKTHSVFANARQSKRTRTNPRKRRED